MRDPVETAIERSTERPARIESRRAVGGTSFDRAECLILEDGRQFFVKRGSLATFGRFRGEATGLAALATPGILRVPRWAVAGIDSAEDASFVVMEMIGRRDDGTGRRNPWHQLGRQLAAHHRATIGARFGFGDDNHCGATPQPNLWTASGTAFWREQRLGHQLALARANGVGDRALLAAADRMLARLDRYLDPDAVPCLIHGDLWAGNVLVGASPVAGLPDGPAVIDPAAYYGDREAELAMCHLFGGFDRAFFEAYDEAWPLPSEAEARRPIYTLYHVLNHLNLFGLGYRDAAMAILDRFA